jgi:hypothetical protein
MCRKPPHPNAEGIADDGGEENDELQRPAAKVVENHRMNTGAALAAARTEKQRERKPRTLILGLDVTYDGFAHIGAACCGVLDVTTLVPASTYLVPIDGLE